MNVVLAGGGTAGHVEPALALADLLCERDPGVVVTCLGTASGLETRLVPQRGYTLELIPRVPLPRRVSTDLVRVPLRLRRAVRDAADVLDRVAADVVVGFGSYVALPAYLAARRRHVPVVVHEANARPGLANRIGARFAARVATSYAGGSLPGAVLVGVPVRRGIVALDRAASRAAAAAGFGLDPGRPTVLVTGGSQGAQRINRAVTAAAPDLAQAGVQVLHATGSANHAGVVDDLSCHDLSGAAAPYVAVAYIEAMERAYAAADLAMCRAGALTVAELTTVGLPAVYVPLPIGNGEQRRNAADVVAAGGGIVLADAGVDAPAVRDVVLPLLTDPARLRAMSIAARSVARPDATERLADLVVAAVGERRRR